MIDKLIEPVSNILDKFVADKDLKTKLSHELEKEIISLNRAQLEVNKVEAAHNNVFVAGWRPFIGWACGISLAYHFIIEPIIQYTLIVNNIDYNISSSWSATIKLQWCVTLFTWVQYNVPFTSRHQQ